MTDFGRKAGDMLKSDYDANKDGVVDQAVPVSDTDVVDANKIKGVTINDAAKADQKVLAFDEATDRIVYIEPAAAGAAIKSVQRFYETLITTTIKDVTITEVDASKTLVMFNGRKHWTRFDNDDLIAVRLLDNTTIRLQKGNSVGSPGVAFTVIEFLSGVSVQRDVATMAPQTSQKDVTVEEVDLSKAFVSFLGVYTGYHLQGNSSVRVNLLNSTTLRLEGAIDTQALNVSWEVVEFI